MTESVSTTLPLIDRAPSPALEAKVASSKAELAQLRPRLAAAMHKLGVKAPDAMIDLFVATLDVIGDDAKPYVILLHDHEPRALLLGRLLLRAIPCKFGYAKLSTPKLRCLEIPDGALVTDRSPAAIDAVIRHISEMRRRDVEHVIVEHLPESHELFQRLGGKPGSGHGQTHWRLNLAPGSLDETMKSYSGKHRWTLRKKDRLLVEHFGGDVKFEAFTRSDQVDELIMGAASIVEKTYQGAFGVGVADNPRWRAICNVEAEHGRLRGYWLRCGGKPVVFQLGALWDDTYKLLATSFLPEFKDLSPGIVLHMRILQSLCQEGAGIVDYGFGDADYKRTYGSDSCEEVTLRLYGRSPRALFARVMVAVCDSATSSVKRIIESLGIMKSLKRRWRARLEKSTVASPDQQK